MSTMPSMSLSWRARTRARRGRPARCRRARCASGRAAAPDAPPSRGCGARSSVGDQAARTGAISTSASIPLSLTASGSLRARILRLAVRAGEQRDQELRAVIARGPMDEGAHARILASSPRRCQSIAAHRRVAKAPSDTVEPIAFRTGSPRARARRSCTPWLRLASASEAMCDHGGPALCAMRSKKSGNWSDRHHEAAGPTRCSTTARALEHRARATSSTPPRAGEARGATRARAQRGEEERHDGGDPSADIASGARNIRRRGARPRPHVDENRAVTPDGRSPRAPPRHRAAPRGRARPMSAVQRPLHPGTATHRARRRAPWPRTASRVEARGRCALDIGDEGLEALGPQRRLRERRLQPRAKLAARGKAIQASPLRGEVRQEARRARIRDLSAR